MDNRLSSLALKEGFARGCLSTGLDVVDIGVNHTPLLYFAVAHWKLDGGATVTGSHNPVSDNGVKMDHAESPHGVLRRHRLDREARAQAQGRGGRGQRHRGKLRPRAAAPPGLRGD